jgi:hypothetical protein
MLDTTLAGCCYVICNNHWSIGTPPLTICHYLVIMSIFGEMNAFHKTSVHANF